MSLFIKLYVRYQQPAPPHIMQQRCILATQRNTLTGESNRCACGLLLLEIRTPIHRKLIARITTASPPVLSPSSILPQSSSHCPFNATVKNSARFKNVVISFVNLLKISFSLKWRYSKLRTSVSVLTYGAEFKHFKSSALAQFRRDQQHELLESQISRQQPRINTIKHIFLFYWLLVHFHPNTTR
jgi:hypothetical protein